MKSDDECHEDLGSDPCGKPPVGYRIDERDGNPYPVCRRHLRPPYWLSARIEAGLLAGDRAPQWAETLRNDGTYEYTTTGDCHGTVEYHLRRSPARSCGAWERVDAIPYDARYPHEPSPASPAPVTNRAADEHDDRPGAHEPGRSASTT